MAFVSANLGLVLFSDAHLGMNDLRRKKQDIAERVREMAKLAGHFGYHILGNGDITEHNTPTIDRHRMIEEAGRFDEALTKHYDLPYLAIHGNHDNERFFNATTLPDLFPRLATKARCHFLPRMLLHDDILITHGDIAGSGSSAFQKMETHLQLLRQSRLNRQEQFYLLLEKLGFDKEIFEIIARQDVRFDSLKKATRLLPEPMAEFFCHSLEYLFQREWGIHDMLQEIAELPAKPLFKTVIPTAFANFVKRLHPLAHYADRLASANTKIRLIVNGHSHVPRLEVRKCSSAADHRPYVYMNLGSFIGSKARASMIGTVDFSKRKAALWGWKSGIWQKARELEY